MPLHLDPQAYVTWVLQTLGTVPPLSPDDLQPRPPGSLNKPRGQASALQCPVCPPPACGRPAQPEGPVRPRH